MIYKKRVSTRDKRFQNKKIIIATTGTNGQIERDIIPIENDLVICNGCNNNIYDNEKETYGWLIYFSKQDLKNDTPYDFYCDNCVQKLFPKATEVA